MNPHSLSAFYVETAAFSRRESVIWNHLLSHPGVTDRQIKDALFGVTADMNTVRPRVNELRDAGWIKVQGERPDALTGKTVRVLVALTPEQRADEPAQMELELVG